MNQINFNHIPSQLRTSGSFCEINHNLAGGGEPQFKVLLIGQRLSDSNIPAMQIMPVTRSSQASEYWGQGSMIATMFELFKDANKFTEVHGVAIDADAGANAASGKITITGTATQSGTLHAMIAGSMVRVRVQAGQNSSAIATLLHDAVNQATKLPVTASVSDAEVTITCKWSGETGNDIDLRFNYYRGERFPAGLSISIDAMSGGTANPDIESIFSVWGDEWYNYVIMPFSDQANMQALAVELDRRYQPIVQQGARAFSAYRGTHTETSAYGENYNSAHITTMGTSLSPQPPYMWAAVNGAIGSQALIDNPQRPLQTLLLPGILPPASEHIWDTEEKNILLYDGIATFSSHNGQVFIHDQITQYQETNAGIEDTAYLHINVAELMERHRLDKVLTIARIYDRHVLVEDKDADRTKVGAKVATPSRIRATLLNIYERHIEKLWMQDIDNYKSTLRVEINPDNKDRVDVYDEPNPSNQLRTVGIASSFVQ